MRYGWLLVGLRRASASSSFLFTSSQRSLFEHRHTAYPVEEEERPVGLVSFRDAASVPQRQWGATTVRERMVPLERALVVSPDAELSDVLAELVQTELRRALVCKEGRLAGLLSITGAARVVEALERADGRPRR